MKQKLSFKEYCVEKEFLRASVGNIPQVTETYELTKYCKFPVIVESAGDKSHITFKPKDRIEIVWEYLNPNSPSAKRIMVEEDIDSVTVNPAWSNSKIESWLKKHTKKVDQ